MARMIPLEPPPAVKLPGDGWEVIATEAGRYSPGLKASVQLWNGELKEIQQLVLADPKSRSNFAQQIAEKGGFEPEQVASALLTLAGSVESVLHQMAQEAKERAEERAQERDSHATRLVELASEAELFHNPDGEPFATIEMIGHRETWPLKAKGVRWWLARQFYEQEEKTPGSQAVQDALAVLEGKALFDGPEHPVFTRLAEHEGRVYLDLANETWEAVEITERGWQVVSNPPVKFRRMRGMLPLPHPVAGGNVEELRRFMNVDKEKKEAWILLLSWLVQALRPRGPYPVLVVHGEQGSAKSTLARLMRALVDPNVAPIRSEPRDGRDLMIAATNGWILAYDNLSHLPQALSDNICRLATGGGFATRELYTDGEEVLFDAMRPIILNGIEELATRGDLLDRSLILYLPAIPENRRKPEEEFWTDFEQAQPRILGALLDAVSHALRMLPAVKLDRLPRMADFAKWATAAEPALGLEADSFLKAYTNNRRSANDLTLEASLVAGPIREIAGEGTIEKTAGELLEKLNDRVDDSLKRQKGWPSNARVLSNMLRRIAPNLHAAAGVQVEFLGNTGKSRARTIRISSVTPTQDAKTDDPKREMGTI